MSDDEQTPDVQRPVVMRTKTGTYAVGTQPEPAAVDRPAPVPIRDGGADRIGIRIPDYDGVRAALSPFFEPVAMPRDKALDATRGLAVIGMVIAFAMARAGALSIGVPLSRGEVRPLDLILPLFVFLTGAALPFSVGVRRAVDGQSAISIWADVVARAVGLFVLGMALDGLSGRRAAWLDPRVTIGVMALIVVALVWPWRRFGARLVPFVAAAAFVGVHLDRSGVVELARWSVTGPLQQIGFGLAIGGTLFLLGGRWLVAAGWLATLAIYAIGTEAYLHGNRPFGSSVIVPMLLQAAAILLPGVLAGIVLRDGDRSASERAAALLARGAALLAVGYVAAETAWKAAGPSVALVAAGAAMLALGTFAYAIDLRERRAARWLAPIGRNSLAAFIVLVVLTRTPAGDLLHFATAMGAEWLGELTGLEPWLNHQRILNGDTATRSAMWRGAEFAAVIAVLLLLLGRRTLRVGPRRR